MTQYMKEMKKIDDDYRAKSGISDKSGYKIFYSHIHPFPLLVLGYNPGGKSDGTDLSASEKYYEGWEHDYVRFRNCKEYPLAGPMCELLATVLQTKSVDILRQVPATNVIFRRSGDKHKLELSPLKAAQECQPMLQSILVAVNPKAILLLGKSAYDLFKRYHCEPSTVKEDVEVPCIFTPNGPSKACIFLSAQATVLGLERKLPLFVVGHPSKYGKRKGWPDVKEALRRGLQESGIAPIKKKALVRLKPIESYGPDLD